MIEAIIFSRPNQPLPQRAARSNCSRVEGDIRTEPSQEPRCPAGHSGPAVTA
jgi:hypothetical protein